MKLTTGEEILEVLADVFEFVCDHLFELCIGLALFAGACMFAMLIFHTAQTSNERVARQAYCYQQGYAEVITSKHAPYYYCFDARRTEESSPIASIPKLVWEDE